ncbi:MAG: methyltransferase domain-containing protein [Cyanobacteria bacterium J06634_5]
MDMVEIAAQLRNPFGTNAAEIGKRMARSNAHIIAVCVEQLQIENNDIVLEIGPGSGGHISSVVEAARDVRYVGIDWSAAMVDAAKRNNQHLVERGTAACYQGNAAAMEFDVCSFDKAFSVNTIYFWENPRQQLKEIRRVLKSNGILCLAFGDSDFMSKLPFTGDFTLYSDIEALALIEDCGFSVIQHSRHTEEGKSNANEQVNKLFHIMRCARLEG